MLYSLGDCFNQDKLDRSTATWIAQLNLPQIQPTRWFFSPSRPGNVGLARERCGGSSASKFATLDWQASSKALKLA